jgi:hypothetical protein
MIIESIKNYFGKKLKGEETTALPEGVCPNCWGRQEWEGEFFELVKDKHLLPHDDIYTSFIDKVVDKHVKSTHKHGDKYVCLSCNVEIG